MVLNLTKHIYAVMLLCMRTTVDLADDLLIRAKKRAVEERKSLRELIEAGLKLYLQPGKKKSERQLQKKTFNLPAAEGGLPENLDVSSRENMHEFLRRSV